MLNSYWARAATGQKKVLCLCVQDCFCSVTLCDPVDCGLPAFSVSEGGSQGKHSGAYWPILVALPFSVQFSSVTQSCPTLRNPMNRSMPGLPVHHQLLEFTQTHVHRVGDASQPSHPLSSPSPPAPNPSQHQSLFQ